MSPVPAGKSVALQIELTLGPSTYCTMAMREALKCSTSSAEQAERTKVMESKEKEGQAEVQVPVEAAVEPRAVPVEEVAPVQADEVAMEVEAKE